MAVEFKQWLEEKSHQFKEKLIQGMKEPTQTELKRLNNNIANHSNRIQIEGSYFCKVEDKIQLMNSNKMAHRREVKEWNIM